MLMKSATVRRARGAISDHRRTTPRSARQCRWIWRCPDLRGLEPEDRWLRQIGHYSSQQDDGSTRAARAAGHHQADSEMAGSGPAARTAWQIPPSAFSLSRNRRPLSHGYELVRAAGRHGGVVCPEIGNRAETAQAGLQLRARPTPHDEQIVTLVFATIVVKAVALGHDQASFIHIEFGHAGEFSRPTIEGTLFVKRGSRSLPLRRRFPLSEHRESRLPQVEKPDEMPRDACRSSLSTDPMRGPRRDDACRPIRMSPASRSRAILAISSAGSP